LRAEDGDATQLPPGVQARVVLRDDAAVLPDLAQIEQLIGTALAA
jgi:hypothetical protein